MIGLDAKHLVFIDETWAKTNLARTHGRSRRGTRLIAKLPYGHWKTTTFVAALRIDGLRAPTVVDGAMNGVTFLAYVRQQLVPTLTVGDLVILDNLSAHKVAGVREAIEAAGAKVVYLPPYSPDLNPIELVFSKLKWLLRSAKPGPSIRCIPCWEPCWITSHPTNAETTSATAGTTLHRREKETNARTNSALSWPGCKYSNPTSNIAFASSTLSSRTSSVAREIFSRLSASWRNCISLNSAFDARCASRRACKKPTEAKIKPAAKAKRAAEPTNTGNLLRWTNFLKR